MLRRLIVAATLCLAAPASAYMAQNGLVVRPIDDTSFAVSWSGQAGAPHFWCAAGDFVMHGLGLPGGTNIYRYSAPVRRAGEDVTFGLDTNRAERTGLIRLQGGHGVLAAHARQFCFTTGSDRH